MALPATHDATPARMYGWRVEEIEQEQRVRRARVSACRPPGAR